MPQTIIPPGQTNDAIEPLESPARNWLICNGVSVSLCGLRALDGERGPRKECVEKMDRMADRRSLQAGIRANTRELSPTDEKKPQPRTVGVS